MAAIETASVAKAPPVGRCKPRLPRPFLQLAVASCLIAFCAWLAYNISANIGLLGGRFGFSFLSRPAGFDIGESLIGYSPQSTYLQAILVGFLNTIQLAIVGAAGSLVLGFAVALLRASSIKPLTVLLNAYVEIVRNTPLLLQLFIWSTILKALPPVREALQPLKDVYISNRGLNFPLPGDALTWWIGLFLVCAAAFALRAALKRPARRLLGVNLAIVYAILAVLALGALATRPFDIPEARGFNIRGGGSFSPEFLCMAFGLVFYHAALVAEIVRAGFNSVARGQTEAGHALGLPTTVIFLKVVLPQALRVIVLPTTALFQGMAKSTSLAVAIGFPELLTVVNTVTGQTGQPIETAGILILGYFLLSFTIAKVGNGINSLVRIKER